MKNTKMSKEVAYDYYMIGLQIKLENRLNRISKLAEALVSNNDPAVLQVALQVIIDMTKEKSPD